MKHIAILFIIGVFAFSNCKAMSAETIIALIFSGETRKTIKVHKGDTLLVKLPMASGTGFVWQVSGKPNFCKQGDIKYEHVKGDAPGARLLEIMSFSTIASGIEDICFMYHRPFEKNKVAAKTKILHLVVQ